MGVSADAGGGERHAFGAGKTRRDGESTPPAEREQAPALYAAVGRPAYNEATDPAPRACAGSPVPLRREVALKLLIGSRTRPPGWTTLDLVAGPEVDYVGDCRNLAPFATNAIEALYASHVLEHVAYADLPATLAEWHRVLMPGGKIMVAVPDMNILAQLFVRPEVKGASQDWIFW